MALAILECPRPVEPQKGNRHLVFDGTFNINQDTSSAMIVLLWYFASDKMVAKLVKILEKEFQKAFVVANVCLHFFT